MPRLLLPFLALLALGLASVRACPGCQEAVSATAGDPGEVLAGFSLSVLFMVGAVTAGLAALSALIVRAARRIENAHARGGVPRQPAS